MLHNCLIILTNNIGFLPCPARNLLSYCLAQYVSNNTFTGNSIPSTYLIFVIIFPYFFLLNTTENISFIAREFSAHCTISSTNASRSWWPISCWPYSSFRLIYFNENREIYFSNHKNISLLISKKWFLDLLSSFYSTQF